MSNPYNAPTELHPTRSIEHMSLKEWDNLVATRKRLYDKFLGDKPPRIRAVSADIPNRDPITLLQWIAFLILIVGTVFTSIKITAAAVPYAHGVLASMTQREGAIDPNVANLFTFVAAVFFILLATPSVIFFKIVDHLPATELAKNKTAMIFDRRPEGRYEWLVKAPVYALSRVLSLDWLTPRLPMVITYFSICWLVFISLAGGGNIFEMLIPIFVEVGLAQTVAEMIEKTAAYRSLVLDAWEQRYKRWKQRRAGYMNDEKFLEGLFSDIRDRLINLNKGGVRPNAWLEHADPQVVDDVILEEFRRYTGGQAFASRVKELDYSKALVQGEERVPPNNALAWTATTLLTDLKQRGTTGLYTEADLQRDYGSKYKARTAWRGKGGAREQYEKLQSS